jgi:mono/diheme cytochrome c family protein
MTSCKILVGSLLLLASGFLGSAQQVKIKEVPIQNVDSSSGARMYESYCAVCHGTDGKGTGPAAKALKTLPVDLTTLTKHNNGKFPTTYVHQTILGGAAMPASHGTKGMPAWSSLFLSISERAVPEAEVELRAFNLTMYVKSLQQ